MIDEKFIYLAVFLNIIGAYSYLIDTIKGKAKPNKVSWLLWGLIPMVAFIAQIQQGVGLAAWQTFIVGFNPLVIVAASFFNKKAEWKITKFDLFCGFLSVVGLVLWVITQVGNLAILFSILADGLAGVPTIVKSYKAPETENYKVYFYALISSIITLLTIRVWDFAHYSFALYLLILNLILFPLIKFKLGKKIKI